MLTQTCTDTPDWLCGVSVEAGSISQLLTSMAVSGMAPDAIAAKVRLMQKTERRKKKKRHRKRRLGSSNMNSQSPKSEPDPDAIKMFVGQVPRSMDENDLRQMFEEFGSIHQLNVLRDKLTGQSKGCCFITFYTRKAALDAQNALHNIKTMPGMQHPIQMKPADSEKRNEERKLFVGMLAKKCGEIDVRTMFAPFGTIEECTVLRDQNGASKGCAFITYSSKQCAQNAIKNVHHSQTMEGCRSPLVVKFADTQREKEMKKLQHQLQQNVGLLGVSNVGNTGLGALGPQYLALLQQAASGNTSGMNNLSNPGVNTLQMQQILTAAASAASALQNNPGLAAALASINSTLAGLGNVGTQGPNLSQNSQSGPSTPTGTSSMRGSPPTASTPGDVTSLQNLQNLQGLAALVSMASGPAGALGANAQNLAALQLAGVNSPSTSGASAIPSFNNTGSSGNTSNNTGAMSQSVAGSNSTNTNPSVGLSAMQNSLSGISGLSGISSHTQGSVNGLGSGSATGSSVASNQASVDATLSQAYSGIQQYAGLSGLLGQASFPNAFTAQTAAQLQQAAATSPAGKQTEGPDGANLFIYHLPQEFADHDLMQMFMPFGNVVSAKVFIDKQTNLSKCFGFVSYDNPVSAQAAIQAMNGFQIGMKRLKVQLKRPKSDSKPY